MNERIQELALKASGGSHYLHSHGEPLQKFAELIVRECVDKCYRIDTEYEGKKVKSTLIASKIAEHFGVEI